MNNNNISNNNNNGNLHSHSSPKSKETNNLTSLPSNRTPSPFAPFSPFAHASSSSRAASALDGAAQMTPAAAAAAAAAATRSRSISPLHNQTNFISNNTQVFGFLSIFVHDFLFLEIDNWNELCFCHIYNFFLFFFSLSELHCRCDIHRVISTLNLSVRWVRITTNHETIFQHQDPLKLFLKRRMKAV